MVNIYNNPVPRPSLVPRTASQITIRIGDHDFDNPTDEMLEFDVELIVMHEHYDETGRIENDIAVLKVRFRAILSRI